MNYRVLDQYIYNTSKELSRFIDEHFIFTAGGINMLSKYNIIITKSKQLGGYVYSMYPKKGRNAKKRMGKSLLVKDIIVQII